MQPEAAALAPIEEEGLFNRGFSSESAKEHDDADFPSGYYSGEVKTSSLDMVRPAESGEFTPFEEKLLMYYQDPAMQAFNRDIRAAAGDMTFENFLDSDFQDKYLKNPQIQKILLEYSKDPAFMTLMQEMVTDPGFMSEAMRNINSTGNTKK
jgi:hypothetical protein